MIDFTQLPTDAYGEVIKSQDGKVLTLGRICVMALDAALPGDESKKENDRFVRGLLAHQIAEAEKAKTSLEPPAEEITLLKERVGKFFTAGSLVRSTWLMLDPASKA